MTIQLVVVEILNFSYFDKVSMEDQAQDGQFGLSRSTPSSLGFNDNNILKTPKRKQFLQPLTGESPGKKRKLSPVFAEKLSYWRERELLNTKGGPTVPAVQDFSNRNYGQDQAEQVIEVVTQRDSPGNNESASE